jgi:hypothetical protein
MTIDTASITRPRRGFLVGVAHVVGVSMLLALAPPAQAAFSNFPDSTWMTNGPVYAVVQSGGYVYIGGRFTQVRSTPAGVPGPFVRSMGVARLDASTGVADASWTPEVTRSDGVRATVYALTVAGGKVWIGGTFDLVDGAPRLNFAALSESSSDLDPTVTAQVGTGLTHEIRAMIWSGTRIYVGGKFPEVNGIRRRNLASFDLNGNLDTWQPRTSLRVKTLMFDCTGGTVVAGGLFENAGGPPGSGPLVPRDSVARFDAATGALHPWGIPDADIPNGGWAVDVALSCQSDPPRLYVGIGGVNFLMAFDFSADDVGQKLFERQTAGNVQAVAVNDQGTAEFADDRVLFGGHFGGGVTYPDGTCSESKPKTARFGVVDLDGNCDLSWWPSFQGGFWGTWVILVTENGDRVWVGGEYSQVCSEDTSNCVDRSNLSRFTDA